MALLASNIQWSTQERNTAIAEADLCLVKYITHNWFDIYDVQEIISQEQIASSLEGYSILSSFRLFKMNHYVDMFRTKKS